MSSDEPQPSSEPEEGFDHRLARLEEIVTNLEEGDLELEAAIARYKEGVDLLKGCRELLAGYRDQVQELTGDAQASLRPYADDPDAARA